MGRTSKSRNKKQAAPANAMSVREAIERANTYLRQGELTKADQLARQLFQAAPKNPDVLLLCAALAMLGGHLETAGQLLNGVLQQNPRHVSALTEMGRLLHQMGRYQDAATTLQKALNEDPNSDLAHLYMGNVLASLGQLAPAEHHYQQSLAINAHSGAAHRNLSRTLMSMGRAKRAAEHARRAIELEPQNASGYTRLGNALDRLGQLEQAVAAHQKAVALAPSDPNVRLRYAESLAGYGKMDEARAQCREVIDERPAYVPAWSLLASLTKFTARDDTITAMEKLSHASTLSVHDRSGLEFSLGKALEDIKDYAAAFDHFERGNGLMRQRANYSATEAERFFADLKKAFASDVVARQQGQGDPDPSPIFVLGMPRSGTSLVEQILASHPEVAGAGELALISGLARTACTLTGRPALSEAIPALEGAQFAQLGADYLHNLRAYAPDAPRIVDKMPANFLYIGLIHLILPNARIIHCRRDPLDNCLSIFKTNFTEGALAYSYDMAELGAYYRLYRDLMAHWQHMLGDKILNIDYETMVADQEAGSRALLAHCGLDWHEDVLAFHKTDRPVHTASIAQVRQPIYNSSVGAAARYGDRLAPLIEALGPELAQKG